MRRLLLNCQVGQASLPVSIWIRQARMPVLLSFSCLLCAQQPTATFQTSTQLVIQTVNVKDKSGKAIEGLTAKDFTVTEDGVPQNIKFFEFQKLEEIHDTPP